MREHAYTEQAEPATQRVDGQLILHWENRNYKARYATKEDIVHILEGNTESVDGEKRVHGTELGKKLSASKEKEAEAVAQSEKDEQQEKSKDITERGFREFRKFFQDILSENAVTPGTHTPHLFVVNEESLARITRLNKGELNNSKESPVLTNQENFFDRSTGFALSRENGERLKKLVSDINDTRFKINHEFADGFVLNINGREFAFFTVPKEKARFEVRNVAAPANDNAQAGETGEKQAA